jgi:hypothetical protein
MTDTEQKTAAPSKHRATSRGRRTGACARFTLGARTARAPA